MGLSSGRIRKIMTLQNLWLTIIGIFFGASFGKETFNAMMNGKRTMYAEDLKAICIALNVSPEIFINIKRRDNK